MIVFAFDVDGTLESGSPAGPVKTRWLERLKDSDGIVVTIVSGSGNRPKGFRENIEADRLRSLQSVRLEWSGAAAYIYVSDNNDEELAMQGGFIHVHPRNFRLPEPSI